MDTLWENSEGGFMAGNLKNDEIRNQRIIEIALYVKETGASTRQTAEYFTKHKYPISNATVHDYLKNRLPQLNPILAKEIASILNTNTPKTIEQVEVRRRIYSAVNLLLKDYTIKEIAEELHSTVDIIYDDLTVRLPRIEASPEILEQVKKSMPFIENDISQDVKDVLSKHKMGNLMNQEGNGPYFGSNYFKENQVERNEDGTFKSFPRKK